MRPSGTFAPWQNEIADKREFTEISADAGYWETFWLWRHGPRLETNNVVQIKAQA